MVSCTQHHVEVRQGVAHQWSHALRCTAQGVDRDESAPVGDRMYRRQQLDLLDVCVELFTRHDWMQFLDEDVDWCRRYV